MCGVCGASTFTWVHVNTYMCVESGDTLVVVHLILDFRMVSFTELGIIGLATLH